MSGTLPISQSSRWRTVLATRYRCALFGHLHQCFNNSALSLSSLFFLFVVFFLFLLFIHFPPMIMAPMNRRIPAAPLPLIRCPFCGAGDVEWWVSKTKDNPGKHFYKCEHEWVSHTLFRVLWLLFSCFPSSICFNLYPFLKAKWPKFFKLAKLKNKKNFSNIQTDLKLLIVLSVANLAAILYMIQKSA
jgi:hypothetical protein